MSDDNAFNRDNPAPQPLIDLDLDKFAALEREHPIVCRAVQHWIGRYYGLAAAVGFIPADQVMANVNREAVLLNAQLKAGQ